MTSKKPVKSVSSMNVLGDLRGLLSVNREPVAANPAPPEAKTAPKADTTALEAEVKRLKAQVQEQFAEIEKLKNENRGMAQKHATEIDKLKSENKSLTEKHQQEITRLKSESKAPAPKQGETDKSKAENNALIQKQLAEIEKLKSENKALGQKQAEIDKLRSENKELLAKLDKPVPATAKPAATTSMDKLLQEKADIEAMTADLNLALSQVESILQLKSKELMHRLGRVYQEAAQGEIAIEFRKGRDQLESLENLAHFVQALLHE